MAGLLSRPSPAQGDIVAECPPYVVARNKSRYLFDVLLQPLTETCTTSLKSLRASAMAQTQYYNEFLAHPNEAVPASLLSDSLLEDCVTRAECSSGVNVYMPRQKLKDTHASTFLLNEPFACPTSKQSAHSICTFRHESEPFVVYPTGPSLSDLVVRSVKSCLFGTDKQTEEPFTLSLEPFRSSADPFAHMCPRPDSSVQSITATTVQGNIPSHNIQQIFASGSSCWSSKANLLARNEYSVYHLQSVRFEDYMQTPPFEGKGNWTHNTQTFNKWKYAFEWFHIFLVILH